MSTWINENPSYFEYPIPDFQGNPLVEALKPPPNNVDESLIRLDMKPVFREEERKLPPSMRVLLPERLACFMYPGSQHVRILNRIYSQVFGGYRSRNPMTPDGQRLIHEAGESGYSINPKIESPLHHPSKISFLTGLSGMGKSTLIRAIMRAMGKTVISHTTYHGDSFSVKQILFLMRNIPDQCTAKAFCQSFGDYTDTLLQISFYSKIFSDKSMTRSAFVFELRRIIGCQHVGALIIDDFQNIFLAKKADKEELIALIINLCEELGVPIILVGTYKAANVLRKDASIAQRLVVGGFHELKRADGPDDVDWRDFCEIVWDYQWLQKPKPLDDKIVEVLYDCSQGITRIMLNLFITAQIEAIESGSEMVDVDLIKQIYKEYFSPLHGIIDVLRSRNPDFYDIYEDLYLKKFDELEDTNPVQSRINDIKAQMKRASEKELGIFDDSSEKSPQKPNTRKAKQPKPSADDLLGVVKKNSDGPDDIFGHLSGG